LTWINGPVVSDHKNRCEGENPFFPFPSGSPGETEMKLPIAIAAAFASVALTGLAVAGPADDIIAKEKCSKCHTAQTTKKAPSWASVAEKYKGNAGAEAKLVTMLKTGGTEDHPKVAASDADLKAIVAIVLSSK
jgi:cytochrome c